MTIALRALLAFTAVAGVTLFAQGDPSRGEQKAADCAACHGPAGNSETPEWPKLAGLDEAYIVAQLRAYQTGARTDVMMAPLAQGLSDQDMRDLGAYFAAQRMTLGSPGHIDAASLEAGESIYLDGLPAIQVPGCATCHGPDGAGQPSAGFTRIGGQHAEYILLQLQAYRDGRRTDPLAMMGEIAKKLSDDDMRAVAAYAARLSQSR